MQLNYYIIIGVVAFIVVIGVVIYFKDKIFGNSTSMKSVTSGGGTGSAQPGQSGSGGGH